MLEEVCEKGMEPQLRPEVWPFLLGVYSPDSTREDRQKQYQALSLAYYGLIHDCQDTEAALDESVLRIGTAGVQSQNEIVNQIPSQLVQFAEAQRIIVLDAIRTDFRSSSAPQGASSPGRLSSLINGWRGTKEVGEVGIWISRVARSMLDDASHLGPEKRRQAIRLIALLSAYSVHDPETGYCQGMSDLAATFLMLMEDDVLAFWCFERLMRRARCNFAVDESGIFAHLRALGKLLERSDPGLYHKLRHIGAVECHFAYRMIVVLLKRDLTFEQVSVLWEMLWADNLRSRYEAHNTPWDIRADGRSSTAASRAASPGDAPGGPGGPPAEGEDPDLFLYFVAAVVWANRRRVLDECSDSDDVLRLFHNVKINVWESLRKARAMRAQAAVVAAAAAAAANAPPMPPVPILPPPPRASATQLAMMAQ